MGVLDDAIREHLELRRRHGATDDELARTEAEALGPARREAPSPPEPAEATRASEDDRAEPQVDRLESEVDRPMAGAEPRADELEPTAAPGGEDEALDEPLAEDEVPATELLQESGLHPPGANGRGGETGLDSELLNQEAEIADEAEVEHAADVGAAEPELPYEQDLPEEDLPEEELVEDDVADEESLDEREPPADQAPGLERDAPSYDPGSSSRDALEAETIEHEPLEDEDLEDAEYGPDEREEEPGDVGSGPADPDEDVLEETPDFLRDTPEHERLWFEQRPPRDMDLDE